MGVPRRDEQWMLSKSGEENRCTFGPCPSGHVGVTYGIRLNVPSGSVMNGPPTSCHGFLPSIVILLCTSPLALPFGNARLLEIPSSDLALRAGAFDSESLPSGRTQCWGGEDPQKDFCPPNCRTVRRPSALGPGWGAWGYLLRKRRRTRRKGRQEREVTRRRRGAGRMRSSVSLPEGSYKLSVRPPPH